MAIWFLESRKLALGVEAIGFLESSQVDCSRTPPGRRSVGSFKLELCAFAVLYRAVKLELCAFAVQYRTVIPLFGLDLCKR
jgi:hypothetical protein